MPFGPLLCSSFLLFLNFSCAHSNTTSAQCHDIVTTGFGGVGCSVMRCVIIKDVDGRRQYWGETGTGLEWLDTPTDIWIYDTRTQAEVLFRAAKLGKQHAHIVPYDSRWVKHDQT